MSSHQIFSARNLEHVLPTVEDPLVVFLPERLVVCWVHHVDGQLHWHLASQLKDGPRLFKGPPYEGECRADEIKELVADWWTCHRSLNVVLE